MEASAASNITTPTVANSKCKYVDYVFLASNPNPNITTATATVANSKCTKLDYKQQSLVLQQMIAANELEQDRLVAQNDLVLHQLNAVIAAKELELNQKKRAWRNARNRERRLGNGLLTELGGEEEEESSSEEEKEKEEEESSSEEEKGEKGKEDEDEDEEPSRTPECGS